MKKTFWDKFAFAYDTAEKINNAAYVKMLNEIYELIPEGSNVLECAGGTGSISVKIADKAEKILCTDMSFNMLKYARRKAEKKHISNVSFAESDIMNLDYKSETYDVVIAGNVLHLLDEPQKAVKELMRVVKKDGMLILPTFLTGNTGVFSDLIIKVYKLLGFNPKSSYNKDEYINMLKSCNAGDFRIKFIKGKISVGLAVFIKK